MTGRKNGIQFETYDEWKKNDSSKPTKGKSSPEPKKTRSRSPRRNDKKKGPRFPLERKISPKPRSGANGPKRGPSRPFSQRKRSPPRSGNRRGSPRPFSHKNQSPPRGLSPGHPAGRRMSPHSFPLGNVSPPRLLRRSSPPSLLQRMVSPPPNFFGRESPPLMSQRIQPPLLRRNSPPPFLQRSRSPLRGRSPPRGRSPLRGRSPFRGRSPLRSRSPLGGRSPLRDLYPLRGRSPLRDLSPLRGRSPLRRAPPNFLQPRNEPVLPNLSRRDIARPHLQQNLPPPLGLLRRDPSPPLALQRFNSPPRNLDRFEAPPIYVRGSRSPSPGVPPANLEFVPPKQLHRGRSPGVGRSRRINDRNEPQNASWLTTLESQIGITQFDKDHKSPQREPHSRNDPKNQIKPAPKKILTIEEIDAMTDDEISDSRISGAAKKKIRTLMTEGKAQTLVEAKRIVMKENTIMWRKELGLGILEPNLPPHQKVAPGPVAPPRPPTFDNKELSLPSPEHGWNSPPKKLIKPADQKRPIEVGIFHARHPNIKLSMDQIKIVENSIMKAYENLSRFDPEVHFLNSSYQDGNLQVSCADEVSAVWLIQLVPRLGPWRGLKCLPKEPPLNLMECEVVVPLENGEKLSQDRILKRLQVGNRSLNTHLWKIVDNVSVNRGQILTLKIDSESFEELKRMDMTPYFGFGTLRFRMIGNPAPIRMH